MSENDYCVTITRTREEKEVNIEGQLTCIICEYNTNSNFPYIPQEKNLTVSFNPLTILDDLRSNENPHAYYNKRLSINKSWEYLLGSYEYEYGFGIPFYVGNDERYLKFISILDKLIRTKQCITLTDLETIGHEFNLEFSCSISTKRENKYIPLKYEWAKLNNELEGNSYLEKEHQFIYHCHTLADVIFSILNFIVIHQYKFKTCALCQKQYVKLPNQGQGKYCPRESPLSSKSLYYDKLDSKLYNKFVGLNCQESMKKFHEIIRNNKKNKLKNARDEKQENDFLAIFNEYSDNVKDAPIVANLIRLYSLIREYKFDTKKEQKV